MASLIKLTLAFTDKHHSKKGIIGSGEVEEIVYSKALALHMDDSNSTFGTAYGALSIVGSDS